MNPQRQRWQRGQSFVELSIGMAVLIVLLGGLFDVGRAFLILIAVENAAGEGALYGATHPQCLANDHASAICTGTESVAGRTREEAKPMLNLGSGNSTITVQIENGAAITAGSTLRVDVQYTYAPLTPIGHLLWGSTATVIANARQEIMSPPPPGYQY